MTSKSEKILREFQERSKAATQPSIASLVKKWTDFIIEVEEGYELTIYDYTNDLTSRDLLQELADRDAQVRNEILTMIEPADKRFMLATHQSDSALRSAASPDEWWWHRLPKKRVGELKRDLQDLQSA